MPPPGRIVGTVGTVYTVGSLASSWLTRLSVNTGIPWWELTKFPWARWRTSLHWSTIFNSFSPSSRVQLAMVFLAIFMILRTFFVAAPRRAKGALRLGLEMLAHLVVLALLGPVYIISFRIIRALHDDDFDAAALEMVLMLTLFLSPEALDHFLPLPGASDGVLSTAWDMFTALLDA